MAHRQVTIDLNLFYQNVRGIRTKLKVWKTNLMLMEYDVVGVTETFLDRSIMNNEVSCGNWSIQRRDRDSPGGGVLLAAREGITLQRRKDLETARGEDLWASFSIQGGTVFVCVVYISPSATDNIYLDWFCKVESFIFKLKGRVIILGDINLNSASVNVNNYYCYFITYCGMKEMNEVFNKRGSKLDIVLVQECAGVTKVNVSQSEGIVPLDSYHPPLDINIKIAVRTSSISKIGPSNISDAMDWNFAKADYSRIAELLSGTNWEAVTDAKDVKTATNNFYKIIYEIFNSGVPKKLRPNKSSNRYPVWFDRNIIRDIKRKTQLHRALKRGKSDDTGRLHSNIRASLKKRVDEAYNAYMERIEKNLKHKPQQFWSHVSGLRGKGAFEPGILHDGVMYGEAQAAEVFAQFFSSMFLCDSPILNPNKILSTTGALRQLDSAYINIFKLNHHDIQRSICKMKTDGSPGPDGIPPSILEMFKDKLVIPMCHIINTAIHTGEYPDQWKMSRVTPVPKSNCKLSVEDYRPIAVLSAPAKLFERVVHDAIYSQVNIHLCNEQHGFRKGRSVETNLLTTVEYISKSMDYGCEVDVVYFDFRKAFDRVDNDILLGKLKTLGFAPRLLHLFSNYLRDRQQYVRYGSYVSQPYHTRSGVSQGSILGPLLFLIMMNDLVQVIKNAKCIMYADDLKLAFEIKKESDCRLLQNDVESVFEWSKQNKMLFNNEKCCVMTFGRKLSKIRYRYTLGNDRLTRVESTKDLGVMFDSRLTFHDHIIFLVKESFRRLGFVLRNCRDFRNSLTIKLLYYALVRSKLEAGCCVWHPYESTYTLMLEKVQKTFLRYLYKRIYTYYPYLYPTSFLLGSLGLNSLRARREKDQILTGMKIIRGYIDAPDLHNQLSLLFVPERCVRWRAGRPRRLFAAPRVRTAARAQSPLCRILAQINALLTDKPECDVYGDGWQEILNNCIIFCEKNECESTCL